MKPVTQENADQVMQLCLEKFASFGKKGKPLENEWTVFSAIVKEKEDSLEVVALGTGSKCLGRKDLSVKGDVVHDSHAEVIARRGFVRYLMHQVEKAKKDGSSKLFASKLNEERFRIGEDVRFLFVTSVVPCGDASIIPKDEKSLSDIHRTGAKCLSNSDIQDSKGKGADYHVVGQVRTKPGRGDPTSSVSCSDKLARWNVVGLQGALLTKLIWPPVHISCLIVAGGGPYSEQVLNRAINERVDKPLQMQFAQSTICFEASKNSSRIRPSPASICWNAGDNKCEVSVAGRPLGATKKSAQSLSISKRNLLKFFQTIHEMPKLSYRQLKDSSEEYQVLWAAAKSKHFPVWPEKPADIENFVVE